MTTRMQMLSTTGNIDRNIVRRVIADEIVTICSDANADPLAVATHIIDAVLENEAALRAMGDLIRSFEWRNR